MTTVKKKVTELKAGDYIDLSRWLDEDSDQYISSENEYAVVSALVPESNGIIRVEFDNFSPFGFHAEQELLVDSNDQFEKFVLYCLSFYGDNGIYKEDFDTPFTRKEVSDAASIVLAKCEDESVENYTWGGGDSVDRERVRDEVELERTPPIKLQTTLDYVIESRDGDDAQEDSASWNNALDGIESLLLALQGEGIDIDGRDVRVAVETALEACGNNL